MLNGTISVPIMGVLRLLASRRDVMGDLAISRCDVMGDLAIRLRLKVLGWLCTSVMALAVTVTAMLVMQFGWQTDHAARDPVLF